MRYAFCNEMFGNQPFEQAFETMRVLGYTGVEFAPFTMAHGEPFDARDITADARRAAKEAAAATGLQVVGLHWLLAKTEGLHLTHPDANVRQATAEYLKVLVQLCSDLGGTIMVLGSPQQRNWLPKGVGYNDAEKYAAEVLQAAMPACADCGVTIALEPLSPAECDFMLTAKSAIHLAELVDSPHCKLHLDVKAMSSESPPYETIIHDSRDWLVHFHVNDPNLLGPGMGAVQYDTIMPALVEIGYQGWLSLEVFKYEPSPAEIGRLSIDYLRKIEAAIAAGPPAD